MLRRWSGIATLIILAIGVANAQIPSVRQRMGLNGPVREIRERYQEYWWDDSRVELRDPKHSVTRYSRTGRCLTWYLEPGSGWRGFGLPLPPATATPSSQQTRFRLLSGESKPSWKTVWKFDAEGRLQRWESYSLMYEDGPSLSNWQEYSYDSQGRVHQLTYWANWGRAPDQTEPYPPKKTFYSFDDAGRIAEASMPDYESRLTFTYDSKGRLIKQVEETELQVSTQTWAGYDEHGNWTLYAVTEASSREDGVEPSRRSVMRRKITYWPEPAKRERSARK